MKLYALARPFPRGRVNVALIAASNGFFKFDAYAHTGRLGISPTGYKADIVTVITTADIIDSQSPIGVGEVGSSSVALAVRIKNTTAVEYEQVGDTPNVVIEDPVRASNDFILFVDISGR